MSMGVHEAAVRAAKRIKQLFPSVDEDDVAAAITWHCYLSETDEVIDDFVNARSDTRYDPSQVLSALRTGKGMGLHA